MKIDVRNVKKIRSDEKSTTLKTPDGHQFIVAHHALSPAMKKQLAELPNHYSDGGEVEKKSLLDDFKEAVQTVKDVSNDYAPDGSEAPSGTDFASRYNTPTEAPPPAALAREPAAVNPAPPSTPAAPQGQAPASLGAPGVGSPGEASDPMGMNAYLGNYMHGLGEQKAGLQGEAAAQSQLGADQMNAEKSQADFLAKAQGEYQKNFQGLNQEYRAVMEDYKNQHINPTHYQESMSSGKKVATAIGLILGGMGSGLTGGDNMAASFLQKQIDRDIESQKANLGKTENLLSANLKQFGNLHDATQMTFAMQNGIYATQLRQAAAKAIGPEAKARALQMAGQLDMQAAPIIQQLAMKKAAMGAMGGAGDPSSKIRMGTMVGIIPQGESEHLYKELGEAQGMVKGRDAMLSSFDQVRKLNTLGNTVLHPIDANNQIASLWEPKLAQLVKDSEGRITPQDVPMINAFKPMRGESEQTQELKKRSLDSFISQKMNFPRLKAYGINPFEGQRYGSNGEKTIKLGPPVK